MNQPYTGAHEAVERILNRGGDADDVLRAVVETLRSRCSYDWVAITFLEQGREVDGPAAGAGPTEPRESLEVEYEGVPVATLHAAPPGDGDNRRFLRRIATIISPYCLVGWDTRGEPWEP